MISFKLILSMVQDKTWLVQLHVLIMKTIYIRKQEMVECKQLKMRFHSQFSIFVTKTQLIERDAFYILTSFIFMLKMLPFLHS